MPCMESQRTEYQPSPESSEPAHRRRSVVARGLALVAWVVAIGLPLSLFAAWCVGFIGSSSLVLGFLAFMIQTFAFHAGLAAGVLLLLVLAYRRWRPALALSVGVLVTLGPPGLRFVSRSSVEPVDDDTTLTVLSCNLMYGRADPNMLIAWIDEIDPDVIVLQEYSGMWPEVVELRLRERYPHVWEEPRRDAFGQATLSKVPLLEVSRSVWPGDWGIPSGRVTIEHVGRKVDVTNVHVYPPVNMRWFDAQGEQVTAFSWSAEERLGEDQISDGYGPAVAGSVMIGDFNSPWHTGHMAPLQSDSAWGVRYLWEAHAEIGRNRGSTWGPSRGLLSLAPGLRLDHAVYGGNLGPVFSVVGPEVGSDHRPIAVGFRWRDRN